MNEGDKLMELGRQCEVCSLVEFKPFKCVRCNRYFCAEHRNNHNCEAARDESANTTIRCPLCSKVLVIKAGEDVNIRVNDHISRGCPDESPKVFTYKCHVKGCSKLEMTPFKCRMCGNDFCTAHRLPEDHECPSCQHRSRSLSPTTATTTTTSSSTTSSFFSFLSSKKKPGADGGKGGEKKKTYSPSVLRFMEISNGRKTALGEAKIEVPNRIYYQVFYSETINKNPVFVFLDKSWTIGKGIFNYLYIILYFIIIFIIFICIIFLF